MNIDEVIKSHSDWKIKLQRYLNNPDGSIDVNNLEKDTVCAFGQWVYSINDEKTKSFPHLTTLIEEHKKFHKAAADIVKRKNKGEDVKEEIALSADSDFSQSSMNVVSLLMKLKKHLAS